MVMWLEAQTWVPLARILGQHLIDPVAQAPYMFGETGTSHDDRYKTFPGEMSCSRVRMMMVGLDEMKY